MTDSALASARPMTRGRIALDDGRQTVAFDELAELIDEEGEWLAANGERIALLADNGLGWAIADLALHTCRLPSVPLPGYFTHGQIQHALDDAGIDCLVTDEPQRVRELLPGWRTAGVSGRTGLAMFRRQLDPATRRWPPRDPAL